MEAAQIAYSWPNLRPLGLMVGTAAIFLGLILFLTA